MWRGTLFLKKGGNALMDVNIENMMTEVEQLGRLARRSVSAEIAWKYYDHTLGSRFESGLYIEGNIPAWQTFDSVDKLRECINQKFLLHKEF